jgi:hypothetical protein
MCFVLNLIKNMRNNCLTILIDFNIFEKTKQLMDVN